MKFVIAKVEFFNNLGYNTKYWRKSLDEEYAICHLDFAEILDKNINKDKHVEILTVEEAQERMATPEWSEEDED